MPEWILTEWVWCEVTGAFPKHLQPPEHLFGQQPSQILNIVLPYHIVSINQWIHLETSSWMQIVVWSTFLVHFCLTHPFLSLFFSLPHYSTAPLFCVSLLFPPLFLVASLTFPPAIKPSIPSVHSGLFSFCLPPFPSLFLCLIHLVPITSLIISAATLFFRTKSMIANLFLLKTLATNQILQLQEASFINFQQNCLFP